MFGKGWVKLAAVPSHRHQSMRLIYQFKCVHYFHRLPQVKLVGSPISSLTVKFLISFQISSLLVLHQLRRHRSPDPHWARLPHQAPLGPHPAPEPCSRQHVPSKEALVHRMFQLNFYLGPHLRIRLRFLDCRPPQFNQTNHSNSMAHPWHWPHPQSKLSRLTPARKPENSAPLWQLFQELASCFQKRPM